MSLVDSNSTYDVYDLDVEDTFFDTVLMYLSHDETGYWLDRSTHKPIVSMEDGKTPSKYECLPDDSITNEIKQYVLKQLPDISYFEKIQVIANRYKPGSFIPKHTDIEGYFKVGILMLTDGQDVLRLYPDDQEISVADKRGRFVLMKNLKLVHAVEEVTKERYVFIILYR